MAANAVAAAVAVAIGVADKVLKTALKTVMKKLRAQLRIATATRMMPMPLLTVLRAPAAPSRYALEVPEQVTLVR